MVRSTGLEPVRSPTRPSNVRVCLFRHDRKNVFIIHHPRRIVNRNPFENPLIVELRPMPNEERAIHEIRAPSHETCPCGSLDHRRCHRVSLSDKELILCYSGAEKNECVIQHVALVFVDHSCSANALSGGDYAAGSIPAAICASVFASINESGFSGSITLRPMS